MYLRRHCTLRMDAKTPCLSSTMATGALLWNNSRHGMCASCHLVTLRQSHEMLSRDGGRRRDPRLGVVARRRLVARTSQVRGGAGAHCDRVAAVLAAAKLREYSRRVVEATSTTAVAPRSRHLATAKRRGCRLGRQTRHIGVRSGTHLVGTDPYVLCSEGCISKEKGIQKDPHGPVQGT